MCIDQANTCQDDGTHSIACEKCNVWQHSKCHGISEAQADRDDFHFVCAYCKRKEEEANQPKLPPLKFRLNPGSPSQKRTQGNGAVPNGVVRRLDSVQVPVQQPLAASASPRAMQPAQPLLNGPSLSPRGQALGPPGIHRSEAAYGTPFSDINGSSPVRPRPSNGFSMSSPPQHQTPHNPTYRQSNGSPYLASNPFQAVQNPPYGNSFNRPASSAGPGAQVHPHSPVKHSPAPSPRPANGVPNSYNFTNSPHSSFPPSSVQGPSFSPMKHSSPPPPLPHLSSPAPLPPHIPHSPARTAQMLPNPVPAPEKHDGFRPKSSHSMSGIPPIKSLSPDMRPQNLSPPVKKTSPIPERPQFSSFNGNGFGGGQ